MLLAGIWILLLLCITIRLATVPGGRSSSTTSLRIPAVQTPRLATPAAVQACTNPPRTRLEMLEWFADLLEQNDIPYALLWGTLLGAHRDQQIIPWTCDIDFLLLGELSGKWWSPDITLFEELLCNDDDGAAPQRCSNFCALGSPNPSFFKVRFNGKHHSYGNSKDVNVVEQCEGGLKWALRSFMGGMWSDLHGHGEPAYIDVYTLVNERYHLTNPNPWDKDDWPERTAEERHANPYQYFAGSRDSGFPNGVMFLHDDVFPINKTGATIAGRQYPTIRHPEKMLIDAYGERWQIPDEHWEMRWCFFGWCWTRGRLFHRDDPAA